MVVSDLEALARAYRSDDGMDPELLVIGDPLPDSPYDHPDDWNAILDLGSYAGQSIRFYSPRSWSRERSGYLLEFGAETVGDDTYVDFTLDLPDAFFDRIIFLNPCNDGAALPDGARVLTDDGIRDARGQTPAP